ncbi:MAG: membrane protein insertion efficiency factor YidD [Candidatus Marinimicrobia bacterium]|jgi:putative membrane protein insertion efficiency factor|nr:membrane protein insertion efficiency factor YidD [Candidatus Neomarinimicrobiota bacterium]HNZ36071.1 membrane protein insertion efficiency factor YidD [Candidatus Neomarinimicrobiota bacterium]HOG75523.1 membrane protein insertion efficiency factor YidD [Candidatus Neomarinimicrobiota bacterium]HPA99699.1 membrane protein insertion efficiency factor YidD [Candidatus Neomarinimicrobiota bacterium]HPY01115.1 membrane protein insertion efficiency factor YidD [Candidatus Neomarinimicrobiota ba
MKIFNILIILIIKTYRLLLSPLFPNTCRFTPTCSQYALEAFKKFNFFKASWLSLTRILKCHPYHTGGYDPLPTPKE